MPEPFERFKELRNSPILDNMPFGLGEVEERLDFNGAQIQRQSAPPQTCRMPVLAAPTLREWAYNTPAETPNSKSLRRLQKPRMTAIMTEDSDRHLWHGNQGEAKPDDDQYDRNGAQHGVSPFRQNLQLHGEYRALTARCALGRPPPE